MTMTSPPLARRPPISPVSTRMLVRVADAADATLAAAAGVDVVELSSLSAAAAVRAVFPGTLRLRLDAGAPDLVEGAVVAGVDEIALPPSLLPAATPKILPLVAIIEAGSDRLAAIAQAKEHAATVMLEAPGRVVETAGVADLDAFAFACRAAALPFGLAGGLEAPDVARLLLLEPDILGFDIAVRHDHRADRPLDRAALDAIRALIPRHSTKAAARAPNVVVRDRIFVRDLVVPLSIGAYRAEHGARQRVRFSVEADVLRTPVAPHDMRDVFSYDIIIETIRVLAQRPHVIFVETLAEEIAAALLTHAAVDAVTVQVEKLDVVEGAVGIEITRRRAPA